MRSQEIRISEREAIMSEYLQVRSNGQITLPAPTRRKAKIKEGDLLEAVVDADGNIRLVPKLAVDRALAEQFQLDDVAWALAQKNKNA
jgi:AbrB family looped-hinge helix DNA binding protein